MVAALAGFGLAGCATTGPGASVGGVVVEPAPSSTRIKLANPDRNKWAGVRLTGRFAPPPNTRVGIWVCRPMACPGRASVSVLMQRSPTRNPDRKALEQSAKLFAAQAKAQGAVLEATSEGNERITSLSTRVTDVRGYPAIVGESKRVGAGQVRYRVRGDLYVGAILVKVSAVATERAQARAHFESFVTALEIADAEAPADAPVSAQTSIEMEQETVPLPGAAPVTQ